MASAKTTGLQADGETRYYIIHSVGCQQINIIIP